MARQWLVAKGNCHMNNDPVLDAYRAAVKAGRMMRGRQVRAAKSKNSRSIMFDAERAECSFDELSLFAVRLDQKLHEEELANDDT